MAIVINGAYGDDLRRFFDSELNDYCENVRNGNIHPLYAQPPTLGSALDTWSQAPQDVKASIAGTEPADSGADADMLGFLETLAWLIVRHGPERPLTEFLED